MSEIEAIVIDKANKAWAEFDRRTMHEWDDDVFKDIFARAIQAARDEERERCASVAHKAAMDGVGALIVWRQILNGQEA
jgi:hypothetical protein